MKRLNFILLAFLFLVGCAHQSQTNDQKGPTASLGLEYTKAVNPQSLRVADSRGSCPRQTVALKGIAWREVLNAANACVQSGQWAMVEQVGNHLAQSEHLAPWGAYYMSLAAENRKELPRAMWMIELALKKTPQNGLLVYQQGRLQWLNGEQSTAQKTLKRAIEIDKRLVDAQLLLGQLALISSDNSEAGKRFQAALQVEPRHLPSLLGWAEVRIRAKDAKGANEALAQAIFNHPSSYRARLRQAQVLETLDKNFPEALAAYRRLKTLERERKLDLANEQDLDSKIRELENTVKQATPGNQLSLREPAERKKGDK
ncbi:MAG: tetratricopeptide repeat protein [Bdellovibrionales bacterium]